MRSTLEPDPCRYATHGLRNNESLFIYFFHRQGAIHRQGYAPVISLRRQWLPDTSAPCKRCRHLTTSSGWGCTHETRRHARAHVHKSNLILLFFRQSGRESERCWLQPTTGKVITISGGFGVACRPHQHIILGGRADFNHFAATARALLKFLTAKSKWIL